MTVISEETTPLTHERENAGTDAQPAWVSAELPEQYAEIAREIARLRQQARAYEVVAGILWQTGAALTAGVRDLFIALEFEAGLTDDGSNCDVWVKLGNDRRLLIEVVSEHEALDRKSPHIGRILKVLQDDAGEKDRVVLAANIFPHVAPPLRRAEQVTVDALRLIQGLGANFVPTSALFGLWKQSLLDRQQARSSVMNLYAMDGGIFR